MKKLICVILSMVMAFAFLTSAFAEVNSFGFRSFDSTICKKRYTTGQYAEKASNQDWGLLYCYSTVSFDTPNPSYQYLLAQPYCRSRGTALGDPVQITGSSTDNHIWCQMSYNGSQNDYDTLNLRITNPYYPSNHSNTINMESHGEFLVFWS